MVGGVEQQLNMNTTLHAPDIGNPPAPLSVNHGKSNNTSEVAENTRKKKKAATSSSNNASSSKRTKTTPQIAHDRTYDHRAQLPLCTSGKCMYQTDTELALVGPNCMRDKHFKKVAENVGMTYISKQDPKSVPLYKLLAGCLQVEVSHCPHTFLLQKADAHTKYHPAYLCAWASTLLLPEERGAVIFGSVDDFAKDVNSISDPMLFNPLDAETEALLFEMIATTCQRNVRVCDLAPAGRMNRVFRCDLSNGREIVLCHYGNDESHWITTAHDCNCEHRYDNAPNHGKMTLGPPFGYPSDVDDRGHVPVSHQQGDPNARRGLTYLEHMMHHNPQYIKFNNQLGGMKNNFVIFSAHNVKQDSIYAKGYERGVAYCNRSSETFAIIRTKCDSQHMMRVALHAFCVAESLLPDPAQSSAATLTAVLDHAKSDPLAEFNGTPLLEAFCGMLVESKNKCRADFPDAVTADSNLTVEPYVGLVALFNQWLDKVSNGTSFSHLKTGFVVLLAAWHYRIHGMFMMCREDGIHNLKEYTNTAVPNEMRKFVFILEYDSNQRTDFAYTLVPDSFFYKK